MTASPRFASALELLDRTFHLLRQTSAQSWSVYACCAAPFCLLSVLTLQGFLSDQKHLPPPEALFPLAAAFLLYGAGRSEFARRSHDALRGEPSRSIPDWRTLANHVLLHVAELALLPFGLLSLLGFPFLLAFFRCAICAQDAALRRSLSCSFSMATRMYRPSSVLAAYLFAMAVVTMLNLLAALYLLPTLWRSLTGFEAEFTRNSALLLNATTITALAGLTGLLSDSFVINFYALVLYREEVQTTGRDLLQSLRMLEQEHEGAIVR